MIQELISTSVTNDLVRTNAWRYQRQASPGLQEYMEAIIFRHYIRNQKLASYDEAQETLPRGILLTEEDYLLGVFDSVGEMMRWGVTNLALRGNNSSADQTEGSPDHGKKKRRRSERDIVQDLRELRAALEGLETRGSGVEYGMHKKMDVMKQCVEKVENAVYGLTVRGRERPKGWVPDAKDERDVEGRMEVETY
jgi:predicted translin family RNA/ssDNA-binding protein